MCLVIVQRWLPSNDCSSWSGHKATRWSSRGPVAFSKTFSIEDFSSSPSSFFYCSYLTDDSKNWSRLRSSPSTPLCTRNFSRHVRNFILKSSPIKHRKASSDPTRVRSPWRGTRTRPTSKTAWPRVAPTSIVKWSSCTKITPSSVAIT